MNTPPLFTHKGLDATSPRSAMTPTNFTRAGSGAPVRALVMLAALASLRCASSPPDEAPPNESSEAPSAPVASLSGALIYGDGDRPFCVDTDELGMSYEAAPYSAPPRPLWSSVDIPHPTDTLTRPTFDEEGVVDGSETLTLKNLPTYRDITHNLNLLQSLQFLISLVQNAANSLDKASEYVAEGQYVDDAIGWAGGQVIPQTVGHCVCIGSCAPSGCDPAAIVDRVEDAVDSLVNDLDFEGCLTQFLLEQLDPLIAALEDLEAYILGRLEDGLLLQSLVGNTIRGLLEDALADAIPLLSDPTVCDGVLDGTWTPDIDLALENALTLVEDAFDQDVAAVQNVIDTWNDDITPLLPVIKDTVMAIIAAFQGVEGIGDLLHLDPQALIAQIQDAVDQVSAAMPAIEAAIDSVTTLWNDIANLESTLNTLADDLLNQVLTDLTGNPNTAACFAALEAEGLLTLAGGQFTFGSLGDAFGDALMDEWDALLAELQPIQTELQNMLNGVGQDALAFVTNKLLDAKNVLVNAALAGCYARTMRSDCYDFCDPNGTIPASTAPETCFLWMPVDFLQSPEGTVGAVASAGLWILKQVGFLDGLTAWLNDHLNDVLSGALGDVADALGTFGETLNQLNAFLAKAFTYIDLFTEGYHLGAYTELRPDLHMCIGYAGHGAYAQMGNLGGDNFSIGARYSSHNVSKERRAQFRSGGFAASVFGHELSILPGIELNVQLQGFKLWDIREPFGIPLDIPISADVLARLDAFATTSDDGSGAPFDLPVDGSGSIPLGAFVVRDLHPVPNSDTIQNPGNDHIWPRQQVFNVFDPAQTPNAPEWEDSAIAVLSAGVNLPLTLDPPRKELPPITIVPGILTAVPWFDIAAGVEWTHETDLMRGKIQEAVSGNLPSGEQLTEEDFERNMHAMASDDLTADNGTSVFVEPGLGLDVFLGFNIWKLRIGAYASLGLYVNIRPGGYGGVQDLNSALSDTLLHTNPPPDAPCTPVVEPVVIESCNSAQLGGSADTTYSCTSGDSSCCITAQFDPPGGAHQEYSACIDDWTGFDQAKCDELNATATDITEGFVDILPQAMGYSGKLDELLAKLATLGIGAKSVQATWSQGVRCEDSACGEGDTIEGGGPLASTAVLDLESLSECEQHGYCIVEDEGGNPVVHHNVTPEHCSRLLSGEEPPCLAPRFTQVDLGELICGIVNDPVTSVNGQVRCWQPGMGWVTALGGQAPGQAGGRVTIECESERCAFSRDTGVPNAVNHGLGAEPFGLNDGTGCLDPLVDCDYPDGPIFDTTIGNDGTVGVNTSTLRLAWEDDNCQTNPGNPTPTNPALCSSSFLAITLGCGSASHTCDPTVTGTPFEQIEADADALCGLSGVGLTPGGTDLPLWYDHASTRTGSPILCAWPRSTPHVTPPNAGPITCAGATCPPGYDCAEDADHAPECVLPFTPENYRRVQFVGGDGKDDDYVDVASLGNSIACGIHAATNPTKPLGIACQAFNNHWSTCSQAAPPPGRFIDIEPAGVCTMCALTEDRQKVTCWGSEVKVQNASASFVALTAAAGDLFVDMGGLARRSLLAVPPNARPYVVCAVTQTGRVVCNDPAYEPPPPTLDECPPDEGSGGSSGSLSGPPGFYPYQCIKTTSYEIAAWEGDGCHPLQHGFASACGCADDSHCSAAGGETCDAEAGVCTAAGGPVDCSCEDDGDCTAGRSCANGSCVRDCATNADCSTNAECVSGACQPKHGISWAETITWGMQNVVAPMHTISSYAFSEIYATLIFTLGVGVEASFKIFGKVREWTLFEWNDAWDIGSTWRGWYQPGLEARYQDECSDPALTTPVTNRFPRSLTSNPYDAAFDAAGVELFRNCPNGGVCRYPENLPDSITPHPAQPWAYTDGNAGTTEAFIAWCKEDMKAHKENPDPTTPEDLVNGLVDTYNWGQDIGFQLYAENQPCIDGQPVTTWLANLMPTYDAAGNLVSEGALATETCKYTDPHTGVTHTFPCKDITANMMRIWGCLDETANTYAPLLWGAFPALHETTDPSGAPHNWLDIDSMFWPTPGSSLASDYSPDTMFPAYRYHVSFSGFFVTPQVGEKWLAKVSECFDARFLSAAETKCECTTHADCNAPQGEICGPDGGCLAPTASGAFKPKECPIVSLQAEVGQCCGDGVVQSTPVQVVGPAAPGSPEYITHGCELPANAEDPVCAGLWYVEECDGGSAGSASCSATCQAIEPPGPRGACCASGACYENLGPAACAALSGGTFAPNTTCAALDYCEASPSTRGACCLPSGACSFVVAAECASAQGLWHSGVACSAVQCPVVSTGACCIDTHCLSYPNALTCETKGGTWLAGASCSEGSPCKLPSACCLPSGSCQDLQPWLCTEKGGAVLGGVSCAAATCEEPTGGTCGGTPVTFTELLASRPGYAETGPNVDIVKPSNGAVLSGKFTAGLAVEGAKVGTAAGQVVVQVSVDGVPVVTRRDLKPFTLPAQPPGSHTITATLLSASTGKPLGNPQSVDSLSFVSPKLCSSNTDCVSVDPCDLGTCVAGKCQWRQKRNCCQTDGDCRFGLVCHEGECAMCNDDADCADTNACTVGCCDDGVCFQDPIVGCCTTAADCDDGDGCTKDACKAGQCAHAPSTDPLCCDEDADCHSDDVCRPAFCAAVTVAVTGGVKASGLSTMVRRCRLGQPIPGCCTTAEQCNDGAACTTDSCVNNLCRHTENPGCCTTAADCNDGNACTLDGCKGGLCYHAQSGPPTKGAPACCTSAAQCDDGNVCTLDVCNSQNQCQSLAKTGCCTDAAHCDDGNPCTFDGCNTLTKTCFHKQTKACCLDDKQCEDGNPCTKNSCTYGSCVSALVLCDDGDPCTADKCGPGGCSFTPNGECCSKAAPCKPNSWCNAGKCLPLSEVGQECFDDAACSSGACLSACAPTPICAALPGGPLVAKWVWDFEASADFIPAASSSLVQVAPGSGGAGAAVTLSGLGGAIMEKLGTPMRVLPMVASFMPLTLAQSAAVSVDVQGTPLDKTSGFLDVRLFGSDGWALFRRHPEGLIGSATPLELGWTRHTFALIAAGTYDANTPKPPSPTVVVQVSKVDSITLDTLRVSAPAPLPKSCCQSSADCVKGELCADGDCVAL